MKKLLLLLLLLTQHNSFGCDAIWKTGAENDSGPTQLLKDIFEITKIKNNGSLKNAIQQTQFRWLRPKLMQQWHHYRFLDRGQKRDLEKLIKDSFFTREKLPKHKHYDTVILCGAWSEVAKMRIAFLVKLYEQGITFDKFYLLGCDRSLRSGADEEKKLIPLLKQKNIALEEVAMIEYLWQQTPMPESLKIFPIKLYKAIKSLGGLSPTLCDALMVMVSNAKITKGESFLLISSNPYICMHDAVAKKVLAPYEVNVETVGPAMEKESLEDVLDSIARCLYNLKKNKGG
ncbi:MAG: hypothetical protein NT128_00260 [Proteobacteria bacterium]|nr:hypothetical protein [Pseudomonadota bacterium]